MKTNPKKLVTYLSGICLFMQTSASETKKEKETETVESDEKSEEDPRPGTKKSKNPKKRK